MVANACCCYISGGISHRKASSCECGRLLLTPTISRLLLHALTIATSTIRTTRKNSSAYNRSASHQYSIQPTRGRDRYRIWLGLWWQAHLLPAERGSFRLDPGLQQSALLLQMPQADLEKEGSLLLWHFFTAATTAAAAADCDTSLPAPLCTQLLGDGHNRSSVGVGHAMQPRGQVVRMPNITSTRATLLRSCGHLAANLNTRPIDRENWSVAAG